MLIKNKSNKNTHFNKHRLKFKISVTKIALFYCLFHCEHGKGLIYIGKFVVGAFNRIYKTNMQNFQIWHPCLKVALQILGRKFYKNTKKSS